jgi:LCP family protein required for cell wall assembly
MQAKINTAYHYGEEASPGAGISLAQASILEITGLPVHYTAVVDFALFKDVVDLLGGIDVQNETAFTDTEFPIPGRENAYPVTSRFETISFPAGKVHLDGETALKYVRSRHSEGDSGTDYDRSRRQQATLSGIKEKLLTKEFLLDSKKTGRLFDLINENLITNLRPSLYPTLAKLAFNLRGKPINSVGLSDRPDSNGVTILFHPSPYLYKGEWVLIPKQNNWNTLKQYLKNKIEGTQ